MTAQNTATRVSAPRRFPRGLASVPAVAGMGFVASWIVGLSISPVSVDVHSTGAEVIRQSAGHEGVQFLQYLFTEGLPAIGVAVVAVAVGRLAGNRSGRLLATAGVVAGSLSMVMFLIGAHLELWSVPRGDAHAAGLAFDVINHADGVKMMVLGLMGAFAVALAGRALPRWIGYLGAALAVTMVVTGIGYAFLLSAPAQAALVSLPLLLIWTLAAGIAVGRRR